jgi:hypothetical protein
MSRLRAVIAFVTAAIPLVMWIWKQRQAHAGQPSK